MAAQQVSFVIGVAITALLAAGCANAPPIGDHQQAAAVSDQALALTNNGDHAGAIKLLNQVIRYNGGEVRDLTRRAAAYAMLYKHDAALRDLDSAVEREPGHWRNYLLRSMTLQKMGRYGAATADLNRAGDLSPNEPDLLRRRGYLRLLQSDFAGAQADYEQLSRLLPNSLTGPFGRGIALYLAGNWSAAAEEFGRQVGGDPADGIAALWHVKSSLRAQVPLAWEQFAGHASPEPEWTMIRALLGDATVEAVSAEIAALRSPAEGRRTVGVCEEAIFLGAWADIKGNAPAARKNLESARTHCPADSIEDTEARTALANERRARNREQ